MAFRLWSVGVTYGLVVTYGNMDSDLDDDLKILNNVITVCV